MKEAIDKMIEKHDRILYHNIPFIKLNSKYRRSDVAQRISRMKEYYNFEGKTGLDLGCCIGGISMSLAIEGAQITGIDSSEEYINIANAILNEYVPPYSRNSVEFVQDDITTFLPLLLSQNKHYDFCICFSILHWILKHKGIDQTKKVLRNISNLSTILFFETSLGDTPARDIIEEHKLTTDESVIKLVEDNGFKLIKCLGNPGNFGTRNVYMFEARKP